MLTCQDKLRVQWWNTSLCADICTATCYKHQRCMLHEKETMTGFKWTILSMPVHCICEEYDLHNSTIEKSMGLWVSRCSYPKNTFVFIQTGTDTLLLCLQYQNCECCNVIEGVMGLIVSAFSCSLNIYSQKCFLWGKCILTFIVISRNSIIKLLCKKTKNTNGH